MMNVLTPPIVLIATYLRWKNLLSNAGGVQIFSPAEGAEAHPDQPEAPRRS